ncbi:MAG: YihY/virulence factor BrkB family protein [Aaplasma endosymbiont of Hyalomma asiaticum]
MLLEYAGGLIPRKITRFFKCVSLAVEDFRNHDGMEYAGYLSFIVLLSMFPFLVFFSAVASSILGVFDKNQALSEKLFNVLSGELPHDTMAALLPRIEEILSGPPQSLLTVAIIGVIWTASSVIEGVRNVLNRAFRVSFPPPYVLRRLISIFQFLITALIMIVSTLCAVLIPVIFDAIDERWHILRFVITKIIIFFSISWIYFVVPNLRQSFSVVFPGALVVTVLWSLSSMTFSWYLTNYHVLNTIYGNLAGVIAAMLFFYVLSIFFIYGAELNYRLSTNSYFSLF